MDKVDYEAKLAAEVKKLADFQKALQEEHTAISDEATANEPALDPKAVYHAAEQRLLKAVSQAADTVVELLTYADKDSTKFAVAKFVIDNAKNAGIEDKNSEHPFEEILRKIGAKAEQDED